ncbi:MAG: hypothetical protein LBI72_02315 [Flavobacteriaceae bacterium]|jgi:hypothetical protein|nr:hypothetical protein [Flavobacteriaceae bacterium]
MEVSYIIIPLSKQNETAFNEELQTLFPFATLKYVEVKEQKALVVYKNIELLLASRRCAEEQAYAVDDNIALFSRNHPYLKIAVIEFLSTGENSFYQGYVLKNRKRILEHSNLHDGHIPLLKEILVQYEGPEFEAFSKDFVT